MTILNYPNYRQFEWKPLGWIPNQNGFRFVGKRKDGLQVVCNVKKDAFGMQTIEQGSIGEWESWRNLTPEDEKLIVEAV